MSEQNQSDPQNSSDTIEAKAIQKSRRNFLGLSLFTAAIAFTQRILPQISPADQIKIGIEKSAAERILQARLGIKISLHFGNHDLPPTKGILTGEGISLTSLGGSSEGTLQTVNVLNIDSNIEIKQPSPEQMQAINEAKIAISIESLDYALSTDDPLIIYFSEGLSKQMSEDHAKIFKKAVVSVPGALAISSALLSDNQQISRRQLFQLGIGAVSMAMADTVADKLLPEFPISEETKLPPHLARMAEILSFSQMQQLRDVSCVNQVNALVGLNLASMSNDEGLTLAFGAHHREHFIQLILQNPEVTGQQLFDTIQNKSLQFAQQLARLPAEEHEEALCFVQNIFLKLFSPHFVRINTHEDAPVTESKNYNNWQNKQTTTSPATESSYIIALKALQQLEIKLTDQQLPQPIIDQVQLFQSYLIGRFINRSEAVITDDQTALIGLAQLPSETDQTLTLSSGNHVTSNNGVVTSIF